MWKNVFILILLLCGGFSLAAKSRPDVSVYVAPVSGRGSKTEDNTLFYNKLVFELTSQNFNLAKTQNGADFSLAGTLAPYGEGQYAFHLVLRDNTTGETRVEGELLYETPDDINQLFPVLVTSLLYTIPEDTGKDDEWRNKWLYFGASAFWSPRAYTADNRSNSTPYLGYIRGGFSAEFHFVNFMSFETGVELAADRVTVSDAEYYPNTMLEIPLLIKYVIKPGGYFMLEPYTGAQINIPIYNTTKPPLFSWLAGFQFGVKAGPGVLFADTRVGIDIGKYNVGAISGTNYQRYIVHLGLGYKYGIFQRKIK
jgi:hypothetical protein